MTLTSGRGPLSKNRAGRFTAPVPEGVGYIEPYRRRVRGVVGERTVIDSERVLLVHRPGHPPAYAFPVADVDADGVATHLEPDVEGYVQVAWDAVDGWWEEDEQVYLHARNPYHRIDILRGKRHLHVEADGVVLVDADDVAVLYETSLEPKLYVPRDLVLADVLVASATTTYCPYKGTATHYSVLVNGAPIADVAWSYEDPLPESTAIRGLISFYDDKVTIVHDVPKPVVL